MIWAALLSPPVILFMDAALWWRIDAGMLGGGFDREPWRWRQRRWGPWAAMWGWIVAVGWSNSLTAPPHESLAEEGLLFAGLAIVSWWMVAIYRDIRG